MSRTCSLRLPSALSFPHLTSFFTNNRKTNLFTAANLPLWSSRAGYHPAWRSHKKINLLSFPDLIGWRTANNPVNCWLTTAKTCWRERKRKQTESSLTSRVTDGRKKKQLTLLFLRRRNETFCCELVKRRETTNLVGIGCCRALSETYAARHPGEVKKNFTAAGCPQIHLS